MAMLAEPRSKQKWSDDPRNTRWSNDKTKFGYQMLSKMGWSEGKGLGSRMSGNTSHVKVTKKRSASGLGSTQANDDNWIAHQDDFNALLGALNQKTSTTSEASELKIGSLEDRVKNSKKKIMYHKFVKSKDLSRASSHDLACIFGQRSKSAPNTPQISDDEAVDSDASTSSCPPPVHEPSPPSEHGIQTTTSSCNMHEYFARKMAALQQARIAKLMQDPDEVTVAVKEEQSPTEENVKLECRKKKKSKTPDTVVEEESDHMSECTTDEIKKKKKKKQKYEEDDEKKVTFAEDNIDANITEEIITSEVKKKSKKKKKSKINEEEEVVPCEEREVDAERKMKKKKKRKTDEVDGETSKSELCTNHVETQGEETKKKQVKIERDDTIKIVNSELNLNCVEEDDTKKKKSKKRKHSKELSEEEVEHKVKKKKKKKHVEDGSGE